MASDTTAKAIGRLMGGPLLVGAVLSDAVLFGAGLSDAVPSSAVACAFESDNRSDFMCNLT